MSRFYSADHLDLILRNPNHASRFREFVDTYRSQHIKALTQYVESRKAFAAIEYANSIVHGMPKVTEDPPFFAANFDEKFGSNLRQIAEALIEDTLPAYLTNRLVSIVTESLVKGHCWHKYAFHEGARSQLGGGLLHIGSFHRRQSDRIRF